MKCPTFVFAVLVFAARADGQAVLRGVVRDKATGQPLEGAQVVLSKMGSARPEKRLVTARDGAFVFVAVDSGVYALATRRIGFRQYDDTLVVSRPDTAVHDITMVAADPWEATREAQRRQFREALARVRARPRKWTCESDPAVVARYARRWLYLSEAALDQQGKGRSDEWDIPADTAQFLAEFRPISSQPACESIAKTLDATYGLIDDHVVAFRIGRVLILPTLGEMGAVADEQGRIIAMFIGL